ncbi:hypothetical protein UMNF18_1410 [Escherichia coli UMNF18]|nr:hypothetical protein [Escherichia coli]AEJ56010.1 hypothetical protein UMNF18_1410 [Escherichia coli UMNF18]
MNIEFYDYGVTAKIIVTCWFWEFRAIAGLWMRRCLWPLKYTIRAVEVF